MASDALALVLAEQVAANNVPGAAAGVLVGGETHTACEGVTNVEHPLPVTDTTLFQVASITKTFVSAAVMVLAEAGQLSLDDPVARHLPDLRDRTGLDGDAITIEHLLSHQAGFDGDHLFVGRIPDSLDQLADARRLFPPGTGVSYNNAAFSIAGEVIARVSGTRFETFVSERLLQPLGIVGFFTADDCITHRVAAPHFASRKGEQRVLRGTGWQPGWELGPVDRAAGGLITSVDGLLRWARFQLGDGDGVLSRESLERMRTPVVELDRWTGIALDWFVVGRAADHGGLTAGYCSTLVLVPDAEVAVVCLTHATNGGVVNQAIRRWALAEHAGIVETDPDPDPSVAVDPARFEGRFLSPFALLTITAGPTESTLTVTSSQRDDVDGWKPPPEPPVTVAFVDGSHGVTLDSVGTQRWIQFGYAADDGPAEWLTWGSRRALRVS